MGDKDFLRLLRGHIPDEELEALRDSQRELPPHAYEPVIRRVLGAVRGLQDQLTRNRQRVAELGQGAAEIPQGRLQLLLENSPPAMQLALAREALRESYAERFESQARSLQLAEIGLRATEMVRGSGLLDAAAQADFQGEAWLYLGNARRINSNLVGAKRAFAISEEHLSRGTNDRSLQADTLLFRALLMFSEGRAEEAAGLYDREIGLRRLEGDPEALGDALINRGVVAAWCNTLTEACEYLAEGAELVEDTNALLLVFQAIAERLAREGQGLLAWKVICTGDNAVTIAGAEGHRRTMRWIKGITYRALGEHAEAAEELEAVRQSLINDNLVFKAALASLDLAAVYVAQDRWQEVQEVVEDAYSVFVAERLERRALAAFLAFRLAARAETLTKALAVKVANFLVRSQYDKSLRFEQYDRNLRLEPPSEP